MASTLSRIVTKYEPEILKEWIGQQLKSLGSRGGSTSEETLREESEPLLRSLKVAFEAGRANDMTGAEWDAVRAIVADLARSRARQGYTPSETATYVFSLKQPLFNALRREEGNDAEAIGQEIWRITTALDSLAISSIEFFQEGREAVILRQQEEMMELSTPVVTLWEGILAVPLIGTLDSGRTQVIMENLLQRIVDTGSAIAIIDITGVPVVDTLVAQHLLKTISAARLMGAECIISGIRPQIAQTIVHLGVKLGEVSTKANLADAFALALRMRGLTVAARS